MVKERGIQLTVAGKARLQDELTALTTQKLPELRSRILEANEHGDISDNGEYEELKESLVLAEARVQELEHLMDRAEIIQRDPNDDTIGLGSIVTLRGDDGEQETWTLVRQEEANTMDGTISTESPVGSALVGRRVGDSAVVTTPVGQIVYTVLSVA